MGCNGILYEHSCGEASDSCADSESKKKKGQRETDKYRHTAVALARAGEEGQKPPSRAQREVISAAAGTVEDCVELGRVWFSICRFSMKTSSIGGY